MGSIQESDNMVDITQDKTSEYVASRVVVVDFFSALVAALIRQTFSCSHSVDSVKSNNSVQPYTKYKCGLIGS